MARVRTFYLDPTKGLNDDRVATFITECEDQGFYVSVTHIYVPYPSPRITFCVTKLDVKSDDDVHEEALIAMREK